MLYGTVCYFMIQIILEPHLIKSTFSRDQHRPRSGVRYSLTESLKSIHYVSAQDRLWPDGRCAGWSKSMQIVYRHHVISCLDRLMSLALSSPDLHRLVICSKIMIDILPFHVFCLLTKQLRSWSACAFMKSQFCILVVNFALCHTNFAYN